MAHPFSNETIRDWFFKDFKIPDELTDGTQRVSVTGDGPFTAIEFARMLDMNGMDAVSLSDPDDAQADEILVIGTQDWDAEAVTWLVRARSGNRLRVYSQEMFLSYWAVARDPFESPSVLDAFRAGHPGIEALPELAPAFDWPSTFVPAAIRVLQSENATLPSPRVGVLKAAGYHTGASGAQTQERRVILTRVMTWSDLQALSPNAAEEYGPEAQARYFAEWGPAHSETRLRWTANSIATFCRSAKRRNSRGHLDEAVADWEDDLAWLKREFYRPIRQADDWWPSTYV